MRVLLDTNILLDVLLDREPWAADARKLWQAHEEGRLTGAITATTLVNIFYVARRLVGNDRARLGVRLCLSTFELLAVDRAACERADTLEGADFEDNLQIACATLGKIEAVVTRDACEFEKAGLKAHTPAELLGMLP